MIPNVTQMLCNSKFCLFYFNLKQRVYIFNEPQSVLPYYNLWFISYLCHKKMLLSSVARFLSGIMVLWCFGHVYKLDSEQLKLVCQSMEMWLQITLLFQTIKIRLGNIHQLMRKIGSQLKTSINYKKSWIL